METVRAFVDHWHNRFIALRKSGVRLGRPLHRRACAIAFGKAQIVAHAELVAISDDRRPGEREHEAVGELEAAPISGQHRGQPPAYASVIELHVLVRTERIEYGLPLLRGEPAKIELVVIAQKHAPLRG